MNKVERFEDLVAWQKARDFFSDMGDLVGPLREGADMVVGDRYAGIQPGAMTWSHRYIGTPAISFMPGTSSVSCRPRDTFGGVISIH